MIIEDTIAAIATPLGAGGVGIIRVSGPKSEEIAHILFKSSGGEYNFKSHHLYHGHIVSPETGSFLDEVLIAVLRKPHSYTGEDTLEINCHGGMLILQNILNEVIKAGARPAASGEFTRRAFLNNRIDLSQAEAIGDIISAKTEKGLELALSHLKGDLRDKIESIHDSLVDILALIEASIDFSEEDREFEKTSEIAEKIHSLVNELETLLLTYQQGKIYRHGINCIITGKPNVGKSSLLNRLLGERRAIVTPIPGTTRDFIEEIINVKGIEVKLTDTAGIREPENIIEKDGIVMVWEKLARADVVIIVLDGSETLSQEDIEIIEGNRSRKIILAINKTDLPHRLRIKDLQILIPGIRPLSLWISAKYGDGIPELKDMIHTLVMSDRDEYQSTTMITNIRHKRAIEKAIPLLSQAEINISSGRMPELAAFDIREALANVDDIVGKTTTEDILDRIFSTFCIGK